MATKKPTTQLNTWDEELARYAEVAAAEHSQAAGVQNQISLKGATVNVGGTLVQGGTLSVIVLSDTQLNTYYRGGYNPTNPEGPCCFAFGAEVMTPHAASVSKQHTECASCPKNQFGSAMRDGKPAEGKACNNTQRLMVLIAADLKTGKLLSPAELAKAPLWQLTISPTNVRNWAQYVVNLRHAVVRPPFGVLSQLRVSPDPKKQINVDWAMGRLLSNEEYSVIRDRREEATDLMMVPFQTILKGESPSTPQPAAKGKKKYV